MVRLASVGLAQARPNNRLASNPSPRENILIMQGIRSERVHA